jgi:hypothetical protein
LFSVSCARNQKPADVVSMVTVALSTPSVSVVVSAGAQTGTPVQSDDAVTMRWGADHRDTCAGLAPWPDPSPTHVRTRHQYGAAGDRSGPA